MLSLQKMTPEQQKYAIAHRGKIVCPLGDSRAVIICQHCAASDGAWLPDGGVLFVTKVAESFTARGWCVESRTRRWICPSCVLAINITQQWDNTKTRQTK